MTPDATVLSTPGPPRSPSATVTADMIDLELCDAGSIGVAPVLPAPRHAPPAAEPRDPVRLPGSRGEHLLQCAYGTEDRAKRFYADQVLDRLNPAMIEFIGRMEMLFIATADRNGECDASLRAGPPGFITVFGERELAYPEYRGNGVLASLGNITENGHIGLLMLDFVRDLIGLHINGKASVVSDADLRRRHPDLPTDEERGRAPERWVVVEVEEAYVHCRKHIPRMVPVDRQRAWGTDDVRRKGGDYFGAKQTPTPWSLPPEPAAIRPD